MIKFAKPKIKNSSLSKIKKIFQTGHFVHGDFTKKFEKNLSNFFQLKNKQITTTASCTASLHLFYMCIGLKKNDEVIMSAQTHVATAHAVEICGAKPVFVDCELDTGNIDIDKVEKKINSKTVCICVTHFLGKPADMIKIVKIAKKNNLKIIEDTALSIGSKIDKRFSGTFGDAGAFSFHPVKIITTGEGGAVIIKDKKVFKKLSSIKSFGYDIASPKDRKIPGNYNINYLGLNYRMSEMESAIGIDELQNIGKKISIRKKNFHLLMSKIKFCKNLKILNTKSEKNFESSYYALTVILKNKMRNHRNKVILDLKKEGIQTSIYYPHPVPVLNYYKKKYKNKKKNYINSCEIAYNSISFPVAPHISRKNIEYMSSKIKELIG